MPRRRFPLVDVLIGTPSTGARYGAPALLPHGVVIELFEDEACTTPADCTTLEGAPIAATTVNGVTILPFLGPDSPDLDTDVLIVYGRPEGAVGPGFVMVAADVVEASRAAASQAIGTLALQAVNPNDVGSDVYMGVGQSNEAGANNGANPTYLDPPDARIQQWPASGAFEGQETTAVEPLFGPAGQSGVGHLVAIVRQLIRREPTNRSALCVQNAWGDTGFTSSSLASPPPGFTGPEGGSWDPANGSGGRDLLGEAIARTNTAVRLRPTNRLRGVFMLMGERDAGDLDETQFAAKLDAMIARIRAEVDGAADVPFVLGGMTPEGMVDVTTRLPINAAHVDTPRRVVRTGFGPGPVGFTDAATGRSHYSAAGQRGPLAASMLAAYDRAVANVLGTPALPPTAAPTLVQSGTSVVVTWEPPVARYTNFLVQYQLNGGEWTTFVSTTSIATSRTITGVAVTGDTLNVRVRSVNEGGQSVPSPARAITLVAPPSTAPTGLVVPSTTGSSASLAWDAVAGATSYRVDYKRNVDATWSTFGTVTGAAVTVTGLSAGILYNFRVYAANAGGVSTEFAAVNATTGAVGLFVDDVGVASHTAVGTRKLRTGATLCLRVRRSSDSTEQDFGFVGNNLDTAAILTFVGAGGSGYVTKLYDQSPNGRHFAQTTAAAQPRIVNAGVLDTLNGKPCLVFDGVDDILLDTVAANANLYATAPTTGTTIALVAKVTSSSGARAPFTEGGAATTQLYNLVGLNNFNGQASIIRTDDNVVILNSSSNTPVVNDAAHSRFATDNGFEVYRHLDGTKTGPFGYDRTGHTMTTTRRAIGGQFTLQLTAMQFCEFVAWAATLSDAQITAGRSNHVNTYGTP